MHVAKAWTEMLQADNNPPQTLFDNVKECLWEMTQETQIA